MFQRSVTVLVAALVSMGIVGCGNSDDNPVRAAPKVSTATSAAPEPVVITPTATTTKNSTRAKKLPGPIRPPKKVSARRPTQVVGGPLFIRTKTRFDPSAPPDLTVVLLVKLNRDPRIPSPAVEGTFRRGEYYAGNPDAPGDAGGLVDMADAGGLLRGSGKNCFIGVVYEDVGGFLDKRFGSLAAGAPITVKMKPRKSDGRVFRFQTPLIDDRLELNGARTRQQIKSIGCRAPDKDLGELLP